MDVSKSTHTTHKFERHLLIKKNFKDKIEFVKKKVIMTNFGSKYLNRLFNS